MAPDEVGSRTIGRLALAISFLPFVVAAFVLIVVVGDSYLPMSDHALTEMHVRDVGHHEVLTGLYSRDDWSHPGPMLFYVIAPLHWLTGGAAIALNLGALAINAAAIGGMAFVAKRRGGTTLMLCTLLVCALAVRTLGADFIRDPWNNYVTTLPFGLLLFLVWSMCCRERWALPAAVVVASFLAQTHVGFVVLALPLLAFGAIWLTVAAFRSGDRADRGRLVRPLALSLGIAFVLWLPVLYDTAVNRPSNLSRIIKYFRHPDESVHTISEGWRVVSAQFSAAPEWLISNRASLWFSGESPFLYASPFPLLLLVVVAAAVVFWRLQRWDGLRLLATVAVAFVLGVFAVQRTVGLVLDYRLWWTWMVGMVGAIGVLWCGVLLLDRWRPKAAGREPGVVSRIVLVVLLAGLAAATTVNVTTAARAGTPQEADVKVLDALMPGILDELANDPRSKQGQVLVDDGAFEKSAWYSRSLVLQLEEHGYDARMPPPRGLIVGQHREQVGPPAVHLIIASDAEIAVRDADPTLEQVAKWSSVTPDQQAAYTQEAAAIDADYASGRTDFAQHAAALKVADLGNVDPAVAWSVAVYRAAT